MRIRNIKNKNEILSNSGLVVNNPKCFKGKWNSLFGNNNPIYLEIGPGKCKFLIEHAKLNPNINYIGMERIDTVLALGVRDIDYVLPNIKFINYDANDIENIFCNEICLLFLNFSDPWQKKRHIKRRLTSDIFLNKYEKIFKNKKIIIQKTDNQLLFEYSICSLSKFGYLIEEISLDLHNSLKNDNIMTEYEEKFASKGCKIFMLKATKN